MEKGNFKLTEWKVVRDIPDGLVNSSQINVGCCYLSFDERYAVGEAHSDNDSDPVHYVRLDKINELLRQGYLVENCNHFIIGEN